MRPGLGLLVVVPLTACGRDVPDDGAPPAAHLTPIATASSGATAVVATERDRVSLSGVTRASAASVPATGPRVYASALRTWVFDKPSPRAERLGYLRAGASSPIGPLAGNDGCPGGWYP